MRSSAGRAGTGIAATRLAVAQAFHSPMVAAAVAPLAQALDREPIGAAAADDGLDGDRCSPAAGRRRPAAPAPPDHGSGAIPRGDGRGGRRASTSGSRSGRAGCSAAWPTDGSRRRSSRSRRAASRCDGLLGAAGAAFALGAPVEPALSSTGAVPSPSRSRGSLVSSPIPASSRRHCPTWRPRSPRAGSGPAPSSSSGPHDGAVPPRMLVRSIEGSMLELVRREVAARVELPPGSVEDGSRLLSDLHLNSIAVGQIVVELARRLGAPAPVAAAGVRRRHGRGGRRRPSRSWPARVARPPRETPNPRPAGSPPGSGRSPRSWPSGPGPADDRAAASGPWQIVALPDDPLAGPLREAMSRGRAAARRPGLSAARSRRAPHRPAAGGRADRAGRSGRRAVRAGPAWWRGLVVRPHAPPGGAEGHDLRGGRAGRSSPIGGVDRRRGGSRDRFHGGPLRRVRPSAASPCSACLPWPEGDPARVRWGLATSCSSAGAGRGSPPNAP